MRELTLTTVVERTLSAGKQMKTERRLGIIGGLGTETSCTFCLNVNNKFRQTINQQPDIVLENLPVSVEAERKIINGELGTEHFKLLVQAVKRLNNAGVDCIAIPCNTVHVFLPELRKLSNKPVLSIMEECAKECKKMNVKNVGLLASATTVKSRLHADELKKHGIILLVPGKKDQQIINQTIIKILHNTAGEKDRQNLLAIIDKLRAQGAEAVILGCTDLPLLISEASVPLIDTRSVLENSAVQNLLEESPHA